MTEAPFGAHLGRSLSPRFFIFPFMYYDYSEDSQLSFSVPTSVIHRALLVDEIEYHLVLLGDMLRSLGFDVSYATNLFEAKRALAVAPFDVIFIDSELPDGFGGRLVAELPEMRLASTPPVIAMTATDDPGMMLRFFSSGADGYTKKPLKFESICENLCRCGLLSPSIDYEPPARPAVDFQNIYFMSKDDNSRVLYYLNYLDRQFKIEIGAVMHASLHSDADLARQALNRLLSLTPFAETPLFTCVVESCQTVARCQNFALLRSMVPPLVIEHNMVKTAIQAEILRCQSIQSPSPHKNA